MSVIGEIIYDIKKMAEESCFQDASEEASKEGKYLCVYDWSGSNVDDAFEMGETQGAVLFARRLLEILQV